MKAWMSLNFGKFATELLPLIDVRIRVVKSCQIRHPKVRIRYPDTSEGSHRIASYI